MSQPVNDAYSTNVGGAIRGGRFGPLSALFQIVAQSASVAFSAAPAPGGPPPPPPPPPPPSVPGGTWQYLSVAAHMRRVITLQGNGTINTFDPTKAAIVDAQAPQSVQSVPNRYAALIHGEPGKMYMVGGLHSNYQGNEIDRLTMPLGGNTVITTELSHQPNMPPEGADSGYASGSGGYIHRMFGSAMADPTYWQPFPGHQWTKVSWHPEHGFSSQTVFAQGDGAVTDGNGHPVPSAASNGFEQRVMGQVCFNYATGKYKTLATNVSNDYRYAYFGDSGWSDFSSYLSGFMTLCTIRSETFFNYVDIYGNKQHWGTTYRIGGYDRTSGNGILIRELEMGHFLVLRMDGGGTFQARLNLVLFGYNYGLTGGSGVGVGSGDGRFVGLAVPPAEIADVSPTSGIDALSFTVDKNSRRVFWMVIPDVDVNIRFYVSTFEDLMNWTRINFNNQIQLDGSGQYNFTFLAVDRQPFHFYNGYIFARGLKIIGSTGPAVNDGYINGASTFIRVKVDSGEELPSFTFQRFDYSKQNFLFSWPGAPQTCVGSKHVNWAYRPVDQTFYQNAGDMGISFTQSRAKLKLNDGTARGYTFTELMDETSAVPQALNHALPGYAEGYWHRPISPDDGYMVYLGAVNALGNTALNDKFLWVRGGDGAGFSSNVATRPVYQPYAESPGTWAGGSDTGSPGAVAKMRADGWTDTRFLLFDPTFNAFKEVDTTTWAYDSGGEPLQHPSTLGSAACRNGAWDFGTNTLWRFVDYGNTLTLCGYNFDTQTVRLLKVNVWVDPLNSDPFSNLWFCGQEQPQSAADYAAIIDLPGVGPKFGWYDASAGRRRTAAAHNWSHKETWLDSRDGKLYIVSPSTGYLWCYETRGPVTTSRGGGNTIPFYPVGNRIPLVGTYPTTDSREFYPPKKPWEAGWRVGGDTRMNSYLAPFKGGLLWWSSVHHEGGAFGRPLYAFWRRLGYTGDWSVVTMPREFYANSLAPESLAYDNPAILAISCAGTYDDIQYGRPYFHRIS